MSTSSLADLLAAWLPAQRWFAGSGATVRDVEITSETRLADGNPELRHLLVDVSLGSEKVTYQILVGLRPQLPPELAHAAIGVLDDGRTAYDGAIDPELTSKLLQGIAAQRSVGPLRFAAEPGADIDGDAPARTLPALASNTSVVFGNKAILKLLRRPFQGHHPDLEVPAALARGGSRLVAAPLGWVELPSAASAASTAADNGSGRPSVADGDPGRGRAPGADSVVLAILSEFFPHATDGWSLAIDSLHAEQPDFSAEARLLGQATAQLHAELAAAFGSSPLPRVVLTELAHNMAAELGRALSVVPGLREYEAAIRDCYAQLTELTTPITVQRIHGDYHLAQVLATEGGWVILDFEGEPSVPLARRRAFAPPLRDVAGMLRSFDYAGRHQLLRQPADQGLKKAAAEWVRRCQDAFCAGYGETAEGVPRLSSPLLRALTFQKAVYEAVYEARHRPHWLPIPVGAIAEAVHDSDK
jgi:maltokinase